jgi:hypothetical protein
MPRGHPGQVKQTGKKSKDPKFGNLPGPGPGRCKGVPNKVNRDLKEAYLMAANLGLSRAHRDRKRRMGVVHHDGARPQPRQVNARHGADARRLVLRGAAR